MYRGPPYLLLFPSPLRRPHCDFVFTLMTLLSVMSKSSCLRDGAAHCDWSWIGGARIRACSTSSPVCKTVTASRVALDRDGCSTILPSTSWSYRATYSVSHSQVVLRREVFRVSGVCGRRDIVRDPSATAPVSPDILNTRPSALR